MLRFVQFADVHIDSSIGGALSLPDEKRTALRRDIRSTFERACALAVDHRADVVLVPGDLFDFESVQMDTAAFLADAFRNIAPIRVFISPGNHDSLRPGNPYLPDWGVRWPENVHIFTSPEFESVCMDDRRCSIVGIAHSHRGITDRLPAPPICPNQHRINILLLHGSRDGYMPSEKENVMPFSDTELLAHEFTYTALGHYHSFADIADGNGVTRAAYSGCIQGRALDETGEKFVILGEIDPDGCVTLEKREVAPRRILNIEVNITGVSDSGAVNSRIESAISRAEPRECDIVFISLTGAISPAVKIDTSALESSNSYFHLSISRSKVEPDYDLGALVRDSSASSLRSAFARRMLEMETQAADEAERRVLRDATYYGLYALDGRKLELRDAD